ncbi:MAG: DUF4369 domain-containing protein [Bacteroidota bacterium]
MKKNLLLLLLLLLIPGACTNSSSYRINGHINGDLADEWIYMVKFYSEEPKVDSVLISDGKFTFTGTCGFPELWVIHNSRENIRGFFPFFLEAGRLDITIDAENWEQGSEISGGTVNREYNERIRSREKELIALQLDTALARTLGPVAFDSLVNSRMDEFAAFTYNFVKENPASPISPFLLARYFGTLPVEEMGSILGSFSPEVKQTSVCRQLQAQYDMLVKYNTSRPSLQSE